jgi:hypothetical protein
MSDKEQKSNYDEVILDKLNNIFNKLDKIDEINKRLDSIEKRIDDIESSTSNMDSHINFVENIYDVCKLPFSNLVQMLSWSDNTNNISLPDINRHDTLCLTDPEKETK